MLMNEHKAELYQILRHYGEGHQLKKCIEELVEYIEARGTADRDHRLDELADVLVVISQLLMHWDSLPDNDKRVIRARAAYKIERQLKRMNLE